MSLDDDAAERHESALRLAITTVDDDENDTTKYSIEQLLQQKHINYVTYDGYQRLEQYEQQHRRYEQQPKEKIVHIQDQLNIALNNKK